MAKEIPFICYASQLLAFQFKLSHEHTPLVDGVLPGQSKGI